ncbi:MAG: hypothetical protein J3Q66DRAFT_370682 [Benniella sp.]|nr:MAG: hypothetical protein J3Q66DRAFT_370682 [Benniella sp.]
MSATPSQAFRARLSSETTLIPTRHDNKSGQHIVLWKDVQRCFKDAEYVRDGQEMVLFLTDDEFEDIIPLRISHYPGVVLEVVATRDSQDDSGSIANSSNTGSVVGERSVAPGSRSEVASVTSDVSSMRISEFGQDNQASSVPSQDHLSERPIPGPSTANTGYHPPEVEDKLTYQERQLQQLQQQLQQVWRISLEGFTKLNMSRQHCSKRSSLCNNLDDVLRKLNNVKKPCRPCSSS